MIQKLHMRLKSWWYKKGHRPRVGSILYSNSLAFTYAGADLEQWIREGIERAECEAAKMRHPARKRNDDPPHEV